MMHASSTTEIENTIPTFLRLPYPCRHYFMPQRQRNSSLD
jgi:hypothetical protein